MRTIVWAVVLGSVLSAGPDPAAVKVQGPDTLGTAVPMIVLPPNASQITATPLNASTAVGNTAIALTFPAVAGQTNYVTGFEIAIGGATTATSVAVTLTGIVGGTQNYLVAVPATPASSVNVFTVEFTYPIAASGRLQAVTLNVPAVGAGNTNTSACLHGFLQ